MITDRTIRVKHKESIPEHVDIAKEFAKLHWSEITDWNPSIVENVALLDHLPQVWDTDMPVVTDLTKLSEEERILKIKFAALTGLVVYGPWKDRDKMVFSLIDRQETIAGRRIYFFVRGYWKETS